MHTYQDLKKAAGSEGNLAVFVLNAIDEHKNSVEYKNAMTAKRYSSGDTDIMHYQKFLYNTLGQKYPDRYSANNQLPSTRYGQLVTQLNSYSLANGVNFADNAVDKRIDQQGFDSDTFDVGYLAWEQGKAYMYVTESENIPFELTEFVPLYDENTGELMAGIRFYQLDDDTPLNVWLYRAEGETQFIKGAKDSGLRLVKELTPYKLKLQGTKADGMAVVGGENYGRLPIIELRANKSGTSPISFIKPKLDAYDFTLSGLQNDLDENAFIYWIIKNNGGMEEADLARFKQALRTAHAASVDAEDGDIQHFTKDIPYEARMAMLDRLDTDIYNDMACVDMSKLAAGAVNEMQINAMYSAMDNQAARFENELRKFVLAFLALKGIEGVNSYDINFIRNKLNTPKEEAATVAEKVNTLMLVASELDNETLLTALKQIIPELRDINVQSVLDKRDGESDTTTIGGDEI